MADDNPLLNGDIATVLRKQSIPMGIGAICMILVNLIDTYWAPITDFMKTMNGSTMSFTTLRISILHCGCWNSLMHCMKSVHAV